jgi:hypothetical protein
MCFLWISVLSRIYCTKSHSRNNYVQRKIFGGIYWFHVHVSVSSSVPVDLACERDNSWTMQSTVTRFFSIVYTHKGKNWLKSGGAIYIFANFIATNNVKIALLTLNLLISLEISLLQLPNALLTYRNLYMTIKLVTSTLTFDLNCGLNWGC